jgi:hypothetical protein
MKMARWKMMELTVLWTKGRQALKENKTSEQ